VEPPLDADALRTRLAEAEQEIGRLSHALLQGREGRDDPSPEPERTVPNGRDPAGADPAAVEARLAGEVAAMRAELAAVRRCTTWRIGRLVVGPLARARSELLRVRPGRPAPGLQPQPAPGASDAAPIDAAPTDAPHHDAGGTAAELPLPHSPPPSRRRLSQHVSGEGIEVGPGNHPFDLPYGGAHVRFVDRWHPDEQRVLFSELTTDAVFPEPDIVANLDADGLGPVADGSQDFVIASHVLEHLANPLRFLGEIHRVLRPGGVVLLLLPDRRRTFDVTRPTTPLDHLVAEYDADVREVDDDHLREFLLSTSPHEVPARESDWPEVLNRHRLRSVHVHCWTEHDFPAVIAYAITDLDQRWELVDAVTVADGGPDSIEFGYVLRKSTTAQPAEVLAQRLSTILADAGLQLAARSA
jgi:SAM-dependent methyltransferase